MNISFRITNLILILVGLLLLPDAKAQLKSLETEQLRLIYNDATLSYLAPHVARCFENALGFHRLLFDYKPSEKVTILLHDLNDFADAGATASPRNAIMIAVAPFSYVYETTPANERINLIMSHELVHVLMSDCATGNDRFFRHLFFGKVRETPDNPLTILYGYLTTPRRNAPRWYHEGTAVFLETWMAGGLGRAQGPYDEMVFRAMVRDSVSFYDPVSLESEGTKIDFQVGVNSYLYGTRFMSYLAYKYGPERIVEWASRNGGSKAYFGAQFKQVYDRSLDEEWADWVSWEYQFQQYNLDSLQIYPTTPFRHVSSSALGSVSRALYDQSANTIYAAVNYPGQVAHLAAIDVGSGEIRKICDIKGPAMFYVASLAWDSSSGTLFYTTDNMYWRDLRAINLVSGESRTLMKDARVGDLAFNREDSSLWGVRHYNAISTIVRVAYPYDEWDQVYSWPYGKDIYDIDISPDGRRLTASLAEISGRQTLIMMNVDSLMAGDTSYVELHDFGNSVPANFVHSPDGRYLYGSSYYTGVSNIFRYDFAADSMDIVTNCETGLFRPIPVWEDSLIAFRYTGKGFVPTVVPTRPLEDVSAITFLGQKVVEQHPIVRSWMLAPPSSIDLNTRVTDSGGYHALWNIGVTSLYPVVEGYKNFPAYGLRLDLTDPILTHNTNITVSYTPNSVLPRDERWHIDWSYTYLNWELNFKHNDASFYDLFGPTKTSRKGNSLGLRYSRSLLYDPPRTLVYHFTLAGYSDLERLPDYQNVTAPFEEFATFGFDIKYKNTKSSLGAVDAEKGVIWESLVRSSYVREKLYPQIVNNFDLGLPLPLSHSSMWFRTSLGYAVGERDEPLANFYFGGFGNNWVDHLSEKRYRLFATFPGVELNNIGGVNFGKATVEWTLPPLRFRRMGVPTFYASWLRTALFTSAIVTNVDSKPDRRVVTNAGGQIDVRLIMLSHLRFTFSAGYAIAFEKGRTSRDEFMVSLKVL